MLTRYLVISTKSHVRYRGFHILKSQINRMRDNKTIKADPIRENREYRVLLEYLVHEAYNRVIC